MISSETIRKASLSYLSEASSTVCGGCATLRVIAAVVSINPAEIARAECPKYWSFEIRISCARKRLFFGTECAMVSGIQPEGHAMKRAVLYLRVSTLDQTTAN